MPATAEYKPKGNMPEKKWDWQLIQALYMGGMELSDIRKLPRFKDLSASFLAKKASEQRWKYRREEAQSEGAGQIAIPLIDKMNAAVHIHQNWLLTQLASERTIFEKRFKSAKDQSERLESLRRIDDLTRKLLGMDDMKPVSPQQRNLGIIIAMQGGNARVSVDKEGSVIVTGEEEKPKATGAQGLAEEVQRLIRLSKIGEDAVDADIAEAEVLKGKDPEIKPISEPKFKSDGPLVDENFPTEETTT